MKKKVIRENWEKEFKLKFANWLMADEAVIFIRQLFVQEKQKWVEEILEKINKDYKGRDITIYELGDWLETLKIKMANP